MEVDHVFVRLPLEMGLDKWKPRKLGEEGSRKFSKRMEIDVVHRPPDNVLARSLDFLFAVQEMPRVIHTVITETDANARNVLPSGPKPYAMVDVLRYNIQHYKTREVSIRCYHDQKIAQLKSEV
jgi:hypothetical protein